MAQLAQDRSSDQLRNAQARISYPADWYIEDYEKVSQDADHQEHEFLMQSTLLAWKKRTGQDHLLVGCELACRWDPAAPRVGVDPDVYVTERPPTDPIGTISSLRTWKEGHHPPMLAIEIVSKTRPKKDYRYSPQKHDLLGTFELWVFDPRLLGYTEEQPPVLLQVFQRETNDHLVQKCAGAGPFRSDALEAWVMVIEGQLVIANDPEGQDRWPTLEQEAQRRADVANKRADVANNRADVANKRADDAVKRADDAVKQADDAVKQADDAVKQADDAIKQADDAIKQADDERRAKERAEARIAELEALLAQVRT